MRKFKQYFLIGLLVLSFWRVCFAEDIVQSANKYELKIIYISEGQSPEFILVVGNSGFKTIESLKKFLGRLPKGSEITWNPGCLRLGNEPLLSSEKDMESFRLFLEEKGLKFVLVPSG